MCLKGGTMRETLMLLAGDGLFTVAVLLAAWLLVLAAARHDLTCHTVRIYNWDGKKYRFLGRERLRGRDGIYVVSMSERMGEASRTTLYLLLASAKLVRKRRYANLLFCAGNTKVCLPVEERMRAEALYTHR